MYSKDRVYTKKLFFILSNYITYFFIYIFKSGIFLFFFPCFFLGLR